MMSQSQVPHVVPLVQELRDHADPNIVIMLVGNKGCADLSHLSIAACREELNRTVLVYGYHNRNFGGYRNHPPFPSDTTTHTTHNLANRDDFQNEGQH